MWVRRRRRCEGRDCLSKAGTTLKSTRKAFLATLGAVFVTAGAAFAHHRDGHGGGGGRGKKKIVVNGTVTTVNAEGGTFILHKSGRGGGSDVTIVTDENTVFLRSDDTDGSFEELVEGVKAQAKGKKNEDGSIQATRVLIKVEEEEETEE